MTANTGRTTSKWTTFNLDDSAGTLRTIPVDSINGVGLTYDAVDLTAFMDAIKNALPAQADCKISIGGPFDTSAAAAAGSLSGSHTVLYNLPGGTTPLALDIRIGIQHTWESGEPTFGITGTTSNGFICTKYEVDPGAGKYTAEFVVKSGSAAPEWNTTAHT